MTKKRLLVVSVLLLALLGIGLGAAALIPEGPGVTKGNFDRITDGMTLAEVETIFGDKGIQLYRTDGPTGIFLWFVDDQACLSCYFEDDRLADKRWIGAGSMVDKFLRFIRWPWWK